MPLTDDDLDRISDKVTIATTHAVNNAMDKHRQYDHASIEKEVKDFGGEINGVKRLVAYATGFVTALMAFFKFGKW